LTFQCSCSRLVLRNRIEAPLTKSGNLVQMTSRTCLKLELSSPPVTSLGVVTNRVACSHPDPLRNRPVLFLLLRQHLFNFQSFVRSHLRVRWAFKRAPTSQIIKTKTKRNFHFLNNLTIFESFLTLMYKRATFQKYRNFRERAGRWKM